jgi:formylglycine-generating enzyme required for sulfatase activity
MWTAILVVIAIVAAASCCASAPASGNIPAEKKPGTNSIRMKMVLIPAGEFMMGNGHKAEDELTLLKPYYNVLWSTKYFDREYPQHRVRITRPFYMGAYHVTVRQFRQFVEANRYRTTAEESRIGAAGMDSVTGIYSNGEHPEWSWRNPGFKQTDDHPVVSVSWYDAVAFCKWLSRKEGKTYRLPTEAEWEYACRARTTTRFYNGEDPEDLAEIGNIWDQDCRTVFPPAFGGGDISIAAHDGYVFTAPVGRFKPNAFRLYDMIGNAQQWCSDWFDEGYYSRSPKDDPVGPKSGERRVVRGCSWCQGPEIARCAHREQGNVGASDSDTGFRVVRSLSDLEMREYAKKAKPDDAKKAEKSAH